jgi:hypothetical protein
LMALGIEERKIENARIDTDNIEVANDALNFSELADALTLDAATSISYSASSNSTALHPKFLTFLYR